MRGCVDAALSFPAKRMCRGVLSGGGKEEAPLTRAHSKPARPSHAHMNTHASTCATPTPSLSSPLTNTHAHVHGDRR